jgi:hypothetical protein
LFISYLFYKTIECRVNIRPDIRYPAFRVAGYPVHSYPRWTESTASLIFYQHFLLFIDLWIFNLQQGTKVVITNLQTTVTQEDIMELFGDVGPLKRAKVKIGLIY